MKRRFAAWLVGGLLLAALTGADPIRVSHAHALLVRSWPEADAELTQPPAAVDLWFSEPLEPEFSGARILTSTGAEVEAMAVVFDPADPQHLTVALTDMAPGIYTVAWTTLSSVDGHPWEGSFPFTVLGPDGARPSGAAGYATAQRGDLPGPVPVIARWLALLGGLLLGGVPLFQMVVVGREQPGGRGLAPAALELAVPALWWAGALVLVGNWLPVLVNASQLDSLAQLPALIYGTRPAALALARQALAAAGLLALLALSPLPWPAAWVRRVEAAVTAYLAALVVGLGLAALAGSAEIALVSVVAVGWALLWVRRAEARPNRAWEALTALGALLLAWHTAASHAAASPGRAWAMLGDFTHLLAAAAWAGGLFMLPSLLARLRPQLAERAPHLLTVVARFSHLASLAVFGLALTGLFSSLVQLPNAAALITTTYGRVLTLKLVLTALALGIAWLNRRLVQAPATGREAGRRVSSLARQIGVEAAVAAGLLISVAVLTQTPPPRALTADTAAPRGAFNTNTSADDLFLHVQVTPSQVGRNRFWVHLYHEAGTPIGEVQLVRLLLENQAAGIGQARVDLEPLGSGAYAAEGAYLNQAGVWDLSVYVRRRGLDDTLARISVPVAAPSSPETGSPWRNPLPGWPPVLVWGIVLAAVGAVPLLWARPLDAFAAAHLPALQLVGGLALFVAFVLVSVGLAAWPASLSAASGELTNPYPPTEESLALGRALYAENCLPCHGAIGLGDGPAALSLRPPPANLQVHMVPGVHTDAQVFEWITGGYPDSQMPAFADVLSEAERWHVLNYIRTLVPGY